MVKKKKKRRGLMEFLGSQRLISTVEKTVEKRLRSVRGTFEKNVKDALKRLGIPTKGEFGALLSKIETLEKRIEKLEGVKKVKTHKDKQKVAGGKSE